MNTNDLRRLMSFTPEQISEYLRLLANDYDDGPKDAQKSLLRKLKALRGTRDKLDDALIKSWLPCSHEAYRRIESELGFIQCQLEKYEQLDKVLNGLYGPYVSPSQQRHISVKQALDILAEQPDF